MYKVLYNGEIKFVVMGIFGKTASNAYEEFQPDEDGVYDGSIKDEIINEGGEMFRMFDTAEAAEAYIQGLADGNGWESYTFTTFENHQRIYELPELTLIPE